MIWKRIFIAGSCRTPIGVASKGNLKSVPAEVLLSTCFQETIKRSHLENLNFIDEIIAGNVAQSSEAPNITRVAALKAGLPVEIPAFTVQRNCGSGLQALVSACDRMRAGGGQMFLVGGTENMSRIPYVLKGLRSATPRYFPGKPMENLVDALDEGLTDPITKELMGKTAENVAEKYDISRERQDEFAVCSQDRAFKTVRSGRFKSQIVSVATGKETVGEDELSNSRLTTQEAAVYPTIFKAGGTVTPANSCGLSDGASSFLVLTEDEVGKYGIVPEAEVLSYAFVGLEPSLMGMGPAFAIPKAMRLANLESLDEVDVFEINEAFAAQVLACQRELKIPMEKLNPWGGAIALGHPVGATGAILVTKIIAILKDLQKAFGVVSMCIGGGQGGALVLRRV